MGGGGHQQVPAIPQYSYFKPADYEAYNTATAVRGAGDYQNQYFNEIKGTLDNLVAPTNYTGQQTVDAGNRLMASTAQLPGYANQALASGFDDRRAIHDRSLATVQGQTGSALARSGLAGTPYGAGVIGNTATNFEDSWNTNQLARQGQGADTATRLFGANTAATGAGAALAQAGGQQPLQALQGILGAGNLSTAQWQAAIQDYLSYLGGGTQAANAQASSVNEQNKQADAKQAQTLGGIGQLGGSLLGAAMK